MTENNEWGKYILYMLDMVEVTATNGLERLKQIILLMDTMSEKIKKELPKVYSKDLIEVLFKLPDTKRQFLIAAGLGSPKTVGNYLHDLEENNYLKSIKIGKEKLYLNYQLMRILESK